MHYSASPQSLLKVFRKNAHLLSQLTWRDVISRYQGSALGVIWSFATPLLMLAVYSLVFGVIFKSRFGEASADAEHNFALILFSGLIIHGWFAECLVRTPTIITQHISYVKKVVFPLEILPIMVIGSSLFHLLVSIVILLAGLILTEGQLHLTVFYVPVLLFCYAPLLAAIGFVLASLGVYLRDIAQLMQLISTILMFMSPIFYPASALPEWIQPYLWLNPLAYVVEQFRGAIIFGVAPNLLHLGVMFSVNLVLMQIGFWWFQRTRKGFADI